MQNDTNDSLLVDQLIKGDVFAFDKLFGRYANKIYGFSMRYLKSDAQCEELVQEVFVKVWEKRKSLKRDLSFKLYLFTIAYNDIIKFFRSKAYHQAYYVRL